jgi:methylaspartate mutase epsilon subunit
MFFAQRGVRCISFSYAQQTNPEQDEEAVAALRALVDEYLPLPRTHLVIYTYMGVYPRTPGGALRLLASSARLAVRSGASRLIVKTAAEAYRLPTIAENVTALEHAAAVADTEPGPVEAPDTGIGAQARALVDNVLSLDDDIGRALCTAFASGQLDVPFCLHPDNPGRARGFVDRDGRLQWQHIGGLPLGDLVRPSSTGRVSSADLLASLQFMQHKFDRIAAGVHDDAAGRRPLLQHEGSMP